jgi:hypothetical protein
MREHQGPDDGFLLTDDELAEIEKDLFKAIREDQSRTRRH